MGIIPGSIKKRRGRALEPLFRERRGCGLGGGGLHPALARHAEVLQFREGDLRQRGALIASARPNQALGRRHASTSRALYQRDASRYDGKPTERPAAPPENESSSPQASSRGEHPGASESPAGQRERAALIPPFLRRIIPCLDVDTREEAGLIHQTLRPKLPAVPESQERARIPPL